LIDPEPQPSVQERRLSSPRRKSETEKKAFAERVAASVTKLKNDSEAWQDYRDEQKVWSKTLKDGLDEE
jgi:hypothetical protein